MAKTVFSNDMLRHVYAQQSQDYGRNAKDSARFRGNVFYSYATPVAMILPDVTGESVALVSSVGYSKVTGGQHLSGMASALAPRPVFRVPFLPGQSGGRYSSPRPFDSSAAACHAGNLAHLVAKARAHIAVNVKHAKRGAELSEWRREAFERDAAEARDYARRFGLAVPGPDVLPADCGDAEVAAAVAERERKEADPRTARKRAADRARREARAAWMESHGGPILRVAGLNPDSRWDREECKAALDGIPATEAGAAMLTERVRERRERLEREEAERAAALAAREAERVRERAEETARAEAAGFSPEEWREMFRAIHAAEHDNRERDRRAEAGADRDLWRAGDAPAIRWPDYWRQCEHGGDILRVKPGDPATLETARGAEVPLSHALRVWPHVLACMCRGETWTPDLRVGHFRVNRIDPEWMTAGCHRFHRDEMTRIAALIGAPATCEELKAAGYPEGFAA